MGPLAQTLGVWVAALAGWIAVFAGTLAFADPSADTVVMAIALIAIVSVVAVFRPLGASHIVAAGLAATAYVSVQALRASGGGPNAADVYVLAASVGAAAIVGTAILGDQARQALHAIDGEIAARGRVIEELQLIEPVTGAYRRAHGFRMVEEEIERGQRYATDFSLALLSPDNWTEAMEGHSAEETQDLIVRLAQTYTRNIRVSDRLIQLQGPDFLMLLPETGMDDAQVVAEKLCAAATSAGPVTIRAGVAAFPMSEVTAAGLFAEAESALAFARSARVTVAGPDLLA